MLVSSFVAFTSPDHSRPGGSQFYLCYETSGGLCLPDLPLYGEKFIAWLKRENIQENRYNTGGSLNL